MRIFKIILMLSTGNTALRGHRESLQEKGHKGNLIEIVQLIAEFEPACYPSKKIKYFSPSIQNEVIKIMSSSLRKSLVNEIRPNGFFSVIRAVHEHELARLVRSVPNFEPSQAGQ